MTEKKKLKLPQIDVPRLLKGLLMDGLQTLPVVGTIITNIKTDSPENPAGKLKLSKWDGYRILVGLGIAGLIAKGILTQEQISFILQAVGFPG